METETEAAAPYGGVGAFAGAQAFKAWSCRPSLIQNHERQQYLAPLFTNGHLQGWLLGTKSWSGH